MADVKVSQLILMDSSRSLPVTNAVDSADQLIVNDVSSIVTKRVEITDIINIRNRNINDDGGNTGTGDGTGTVTGGDLTVNGDLIFNGDLTDQFGNTVTDLSTLVTETELTEAIENIVGDDTLNCIRDSAPTTSGFDCGIKILGETTIDSDLYVRGIYYGDGSGLTDIQFAIAADSATNATNALVAQLADLATQAVFATGADSATTATTAGCALKTANTTNNDNVTNYLLFSENRDQCDSVHTDPNLEYNPLSNTLTVGFIQGDGSLLANVNATSATAATITSNVATVDGVHYLLMKQTATGADSALTDAQLVYNPIDNILSDQGDGANLFMVGTAKNSTRQTAKTAVGETNYLLMRNDITAGDADSASFATGLTFNATTETLNVTNLAGDGAGISNINATSAITTTNVTISSVSDDATYYLHMGSATSGGDGVDIDADLRFNPSTNRMSIVADNGGLEIGAEAGGDMQITHDWTDATINTTTGGLQITSGAGTNVVVIDSLPTVDTGLATGQLWNDGGTLKISAGS